MRSPINEGIEAVVNNHIARRRWLFCVTILALAVWFLTAAILKYNGKALNNEAETSTEETVKGLSDAMVLAFEPYSNDDNAYILQESDFNEIVVRIKNGNDWEVVDLNNTVLVQGTEIRLDVKYKFVADKEIVFYELPSQMVLPEEITGDLLDSATKTKAGMLYATPDGIVKLVYDKEYLDSHPDLSEAEFYIQATLEKEAGDETGDIIFFTGKGQVTIKTRKESDLSIGKTAELVDEKTVKYVVTATTTKGSDGQVTIEDSLQGNVNAGNASIGAISISKVSTNGTYSLDPSQYQLQGGSGYNYFIYSNLPALMPGEKYLVTYYVNTGDVVYNEDGSAVLNNKAVAGDAFNKVEITVPVDLSKPKANKEFSGRDGNKLKWTIRVNNPTGMDLAGKQITDQMISDPNQFYTMKYVSNSLQRDWNQSILDTDPSMNVTEAGWTYTFPEGSTNYQYHFTFETEMVGMKEGATYYVTNRGNFNNIEFYAEAKISVKEEELTKPDYEGEISKQLTANEKVEGKDTLEKLIWNVNVKASDDNSMTLIITDRIIDAYNTSNGKSFTGSHFTTSEELQALVNQLSDRYLVKYTAYQDETFGEEAYDDMRIKSFKLEIQKKDGSRFAEKEEVSYSYTTFAEEGLMSSGDSWRFTNYTNYYQRESKATFDKITKKNIEKYSKGDKESYGDGYQVSYGDGTIHYVVILRFNGDEQGDIKLYDHAASGMELVKESVDVFYWNYNNLTNIQFGSEFKGQIASGLDGENEFTYAYRPFEYQGKRYVPKEHLEVAQDENDARLYGMTIKDYPEGAYSSALIIMYDMKLTGNEWKQPQSVIETKGNTVSWENHGEDDTLITIRKEADTIEKRAKLNRNLKNAIDYTVDINPTALNLDERSDTITLTDDFDIYEKNQKLDYLASLELGTVKLYSYESYYAFDLDGNRMKDDSGEYLLADSKDWVEISTERYMVSYDQNSHHMTIVLPDQLACVLNYEYMLGTVDKDELTVKNSIMLSGTQVKKDTDLVWKSASGGGMVTSGVKLIKVDSKDYTKRLSGVEFDLYMTNGNNGWTKLNKEPLVTSSQKGKEGEIQLSSYLKKTEDKHQYDTSILYKLVEVKANENYSPKTYYFAFGENGVAKVQNPDQRSDGEVIVLSPAGGSIYAPNEYTAVTVNKTWVDKNKNEVKAPENAMIQVELHEGQVKSCRVELIDFNNQLVGSYLVAPNTAFNFKVYDKVEAVKHATVISETRQAGESLEESDVDPTDFVDNQNTWAVAHFFTTEITENCQIKLNEWVQAIDQANYTSPSEYTDEGLVDREDSVVYLSSANNWTYTWTGLDTNKEYFVSEVSGPSGWIPTYLNNGGVNSGNITIMNVEIPHYVMPSTGGVGTIRYTLGGFVLILIGLMYGFVLKHRRERGLENSE